MPLVVHEQNAVAGLTNRVLARLADRVLAGFPGRLRPARKARACTSAIRCARRSPRCRRPSDASPGAAGRCGCSSSAAARAPARSTRSCRGALPDCPPASGPEVRHQAGEAHRRRPRAAYRDVPGVEAECGRSSTTWPRPTAGPIWSLCRAGALTVAELAAAGVGARCWCRFRTPWTTTRPRNARLPGRRAAPRVLLPQRELDAGAARAELLRGLAGDRELAAQMAAARRARRRRRRRHRDASRRLRLPGGAPMRDRCVDSAFTSSASAAPA
ncbi:MAG: hypothetical protein MZV65_34485 [Chromatiales bacterium]|nr:hypothetical protein [Chromatiales bacterium]